jgi:hypothetical protein
MKATNVPIASLPACGNRCFGSRLALRLRRRSVSAGLPLRDAITSVMSKRPELQAAAEVRHTPAPLRRRTGFIPNPRHFYQSENLRPGMDITQGVDMPTRPRSSRLREDGVRALP